MTERAFHTWWHLIGAKHSGNREWLDGYNGPGVKSSEADCGTICDMPSKHGIHVAEYWTNVPSLPCDCCSFSPPASSSASRLPTLRCICPLSTSNFHLDIRHRTGLNTSIASWRPIVSDSASWPHSGPPTFAWSSGSPMFPRMLTSRRKRNVENVAYWEGASLTVDFESICCRKLNIKREMKIEGPLHMSKMQGVRYVSVVRKWFCVPDGYNISYDRDHWRDRVGRDHWTFLWHSLSIVNICRTYETWRKITYNKGDSDTVQFRKEQNAGGNCSCS